MTHLQIGFRFCCLMCLLICSISLTAVAEHHDSSKTEEMAEMGPPEEMKQVESLVGTWDVTAKYKMDPMAKEWTKSKASCTYSMALDGAALIMDYEGPMMGMPYRGMAVQCYDRERKEWQAIWVDNMMGRMSMFSGGHEGDEMVMTGKELYDGMEFLAKITTYNMKKDSFDWKYEVSMDGGETWLTTVESRYTKVK